MNCGYRNKRDFNNGNKFVGNYDKSVYCLFFQNILINNSDHRVGIVYCHPNHFLLDYSVNNIKK